MYSGREREKERDQNGLRLRTYTVSYNVRSSQRAASGFLSEVIKPERVFFFLKAMPFFYFLCFFISTTENSL